MLFLTKIPTEITPYPCNEIQFESGEALDVQTGALDFVNMPKRQRSKKQIDDIIPVVAEGMAFALPTTPYDHAISNVAYANDSSEDGFTGKTYESNSSGEDFHSSSTKYDGNEHLCRNPTGAP